MAENNVLRNCLKLKEKTNIVQIWLASFLAMTGSTRFVSTTEQWEYRHCETV
jgi:hypothetical protein